MNSLEIEVKFYLKDLQPLRRQLLDLKAESRGRFFEQNIRYEDSENRFLRNKSLLRLRRADQATLTFKSEPPRQDRDFKVHEELEVTVSDFETADRILLALGFRHAQTYEKWRETLVLGDTIFCLDTLPFGHFLEIEGRREAIQDMAHKLGLAWETRILANYLALFHRLKTALNIPFMDITFENFKAARLEAAACGDLIAAQMGPLHEPERA